ncbi:hypothetical protein ACFQ07_06330 [Actinomadura adrarensis]|uniref:Antitoxin n=1 Tax=Actinomadura adrarensis TaxID=1819600 RepID=A0ABW3CBZ3_9ACTN
MKIAVRVTVEMTDEQIQGLATEYGLGDGETVPAAEVREWVTSYFNEYAHQAYAAQFWTATVR